LFLKQRLSLKGKSIKEAQKTYRISHVDESVAKTITEVFENYLSVAAAYYLFMFCKLSSELLRCYEIDWKSRIIAITESYVVLDKPAGTSVCNSWKFYSTRYFS